MITLIKKEITKLRERERKVKSFFVSFYAIGFIGLILPFSNPFFLKLTPYALLLSVSALAVFHKAKIDKKLILVLTGIFLAGFIVELIGVNGGYIFGEYRYGSGLGLKLRKTPLLIGMNWVLMVYLTANIVTRLDLSSLPSILLSSLLMLGYDIILEQVASYLDMWHWYDHTIPVQNYVAWFLLALIFHSVLKIFRIRTENNLAPLLLICQVVFFLFLLIVNKFTP